MITIRTVYTSPSLTADQIESVVMQVITESSLAGRIMNKMQVNKQDDCIVMTAVYKDDYEIDNEWWMHIDEISQMREKITLNNIQYAKERIEA